MSASAVEDPGKKLVGSGSPPLLRNEFEAESAGFDGAFVAESRVSSRPFWSMTDSGGDRLAPSCCLRLAFS